MVNTQLLSKCFNKHCQKQDEKLQKDVSDRLKEYIEEWGDDRYECDIAKQTHSYYLNKLSPSYEDHVEYFVAVILMKLLIEGEVERIA